VAETEIEMLKKLLQDLHDGKKIILETRKNQTGEDVAVDYVYFENGRWMRGRLNCWSSSDYGFGTCQCVSHDPFSEDRISRKEMLSHLRQLIREVEQDSQAREVEMAWLENAISTAPEL
jgi:hypothetical protein